LLTSSAKGWIKIVEEEGKLKVDGFKVYYIYSKFIKKESSTVGGSAKVEPL